MSMRRLSNEEKKMRMLYRVPVRAIPVRFEAGKIDDSYIREAFENCDIPNKTLIGIPAVYIDEGGGVESIADVFMVMKIKKVDDQWFAMLSTMLDEDESKLYAVKYVQFISVHYDSITDRFELNELAAIMTEDRYKTVPVIFSTGDEETDNRLEEAFINLSVDDRNSLNRPIVVNYRWAEVDYIDGSHVTYKVYTELGDRFVKIDYFAPGKDGWFAKITVDKEHAHLLDKIDAVTVAKYSSTYQTEYSILDLLVEIEED